MLRGAFDFLEYISLSLDEKADADAGAVLMDFFRVRKRKIGFQKLNVAD